LNVERGWIDVTYNRELQKKVSEITTHVPYQLPIGIPPLKTVGPSVRGFMLCITAQNA